MGICDFFTWCVYCHLLLILVLYSRNKLVSWYVYKWIRGGQTVLQSTAWEPGLFLSSQQEVGNQATLGFMYQQKQRGGDTQCTLKSTGSLIFLQGQGLGLIITSVSLMRWPGLSETAQVGRKSLLGLIWTVVLFL